MSGMASANGSRLGSRALGELTMASGLQRRCMSTTQSLQAVAAATKTKKYRGNPGLNVVLKKVREKIVYPTYLSLEDQKKIYKPKYKKALELDPIEMTIDGRERKFGYVDRMNDLPNTAKAVETAVRRMKTPADFKKLTHLLRGVCGRAHRKLAPELFVYMVRRAAAANGIDTIIDCIRLADETGFKLNHSQLVNEVFLAILTPVINSGWEDKAMRLALKRANTVFELMELDRKSHKPIETPGMPKAAFAFHRDPQFLAMRLHLAAGLAARYQERKDRKETGTGDNGELVKWAAQLVRLWPDTVGLVDLQPVDAFQQSRTSMSYLLDSDYFLKTAAPVLSGLMLAHKVRYEDKELSSFLKYELRKRIDSVKEQISVAMAKPDANGEGRALYDKLFPNGLGHPKRVRHWLPKPAVPEKAAVATPEAAAEEVGAKVEAE